MNQNLQEIDKIYQQLIEHIHFIKNIINWELSNDNHYLAIKMNNQIILLNCTNMLSQQILNCSYFSSSLFSKNSEYFIYQLSRNRCAVKNLRTKASSSTTLIRIPQDSKLSAFDGNKIFLKLYLRSSDTELLIYDLKTKNPLSRARLNNCFFSLQEIRNYNGMIFHQWMYQKHKQLRIRFDGYLKYENQSILITERGFKKVMLWNQQTRKLLRNLETSNYVQRIYTESNDSIVLIKRCSQNSNIEVYSFTIGKYFQLSKKEQRLVSFKHCMSSFRKLLKIQ